MLQDSSTEEPNRNMPLRIHATYHQRLLIFNRGSSENGIYFKKLCTLKKINIRNMFSSQERSQKKYIQNLKTKNYIHYPLGFWNKFGCPSFKIQVCPVDHMILFLK